MKYSAHWVPPTPYVVTTTPDYFTPPPSPFRPCATLPFDDCTPCPPTPRFVPYDEGESDTRSTGTSKPTSAVNNPVMVEPLHSATFTPLDDTTDLENGTSEVDSTTLTDPSDADMTDSETVICESTSSADDMTNSETRTSEPPSPAGPPNDWLIPGPTNFTSFLGPFTNETIVNSNDQAYLDGQSHLSDILLYAFGIYAQPSPVLMIIQRAQMDWYGHRNLPINPSTCTKPFKLFSLTGGRTPRTGFDSHDHQTIRYYTKRPFPCPFKDEFFLSYCYPISVIEAVHQSLRTDWFLVYPRPIPILIIRLRDLIGPYALDRRVDGFAYVLSSQDSSWPIIDRRAIGSDYRPRVPCAVEINMCSKGDAVYPPQHIVASKFAANVFVECTPTPGQGPRCEYLGAYVLQVMETMTLHSAVWAGILPDVQRSAYARLPLTFNDGLPYLPYVRFLYYKWDRQILGLADEIAQTRFLSAAQRTDVADDPGFEFRYESEY